MKIIDNRNKLISFDKIEIGEVFLCDDDFFMKIEEVMIEKPIHRKINTIRLKDGTVKFIHPLIAGTKVNYDFIIKNGEDC